MTASTRQRRHFRGGRAGLLSLRAAEQQEPRQQTARAPPSADNAAAASAAGAGAGAGEDEGGIMGYCSIDPASGKRRRLSDGEKERLYLEAVYGYYNGEPLMSNEEFNILKEDLQWMGSRVIVLSRDEQRFLSAAQAYYNGKPVMGDDAFDELKTRLKRQGSGIAVQKGARCSVETGTCFSDCQVDKLRQTVLYAPATGVGALIWAAVSFELTPLRHVNPLLSLLIGAPLIYAFGAFVTQMVLQRDPTIVTGDCPTCSAEQRVFFGDVLGVGGFRDVADIKCGKCKSPLRVDRNRMQIEQLPKTMLVKKGEGDVVVKKKPDDGGSGGGDAGKSSSTAGAS